jgi:hypothetical protein
MSRILTSACVSLCILAPSVGARTISMESLLQEMVNRDNLARFPEPAYTCKQFSSYDRNADTPGSPTWWANMDRSYFLRVEENQGRKEHVLMDAQGPGAVVRFWATWHGPGGGPFSNGTMRIYLDGNETPVVEGPFEDVIDKGFLTGPPLSQGVSPLTDYRRRGHNLYLPIPYAKQCKITYECKVLIDDGGRKGEALYYQINYRSYAPSAQVRTFSMRDLTRAQETLDRVQKMLVQNPAASLDVAAEKTEPSTLAPGKDLRVRVDGEGHAISEVIVKLQADDLEQALRSTVLQIKFDGQRTVWCPVGDFFGTGYKINAYSTWYTAVAPDGTLSCYWRMPYQQTAVVSLLNLGKQAVTVEALRVRVCPWQWDQRSLYFNTSWKQWYKIVTKANTHARDHGASDLNWATIQGEGIYVGDTLTLFNGAASWWGEGDEKIYVDGETFPSHFGTGTEDYYGYAWCRPEKFDAPFQAQPDGGGNLKGGFSVNSRYRALDAIPFTRSLRFDMELWHWAKTKMNYAPACFWYARAGAECNVEPMPEEARRKVALVMEDVVEIKRVKGAIEGEACRIQRRTGGRTEIQAGAQFDWSGQRQLWWIDAAIKDELILELPVKRAGTYAVTAALTKAVDYGIVKISLNGRVLTEKLDLYNPSVITKEVDLGSCELTQGVNQFVIRIVGANAKAIKRYMFGLDYLLLKRTR